MDKDSNKNNKWGEDNNKMNIWNKFQKKFWRFGILFNFFSPDQFFWEFCNSVSGRFKRLAPAPKLKLSEPLHVVSGLLVFHRVSTQQIKIGKGCYSPFSAV